MELLLIRHALPIRVEGAAGPADPPLSDIGRRQSESMVRWLEPEPLDALVVSPMIRARETATPLATARGLETVVHEGVAEFDKDADSYVPMEELKAAGDPRWQEIVDGGYFGDGDLTPEQFQATVVDAVEEVIAANAGGTAAIVCHGGVINAYVAHVLGIDDLLFFEPGYTSINRIRASRRGHRMVVSLNETAHLRDV
ncbi:MAG TPA: histidine phosphatase family protein [Acidimicrobiales bacterium]|nr:histidine phosphatase family protein [Acidimicrobiales bacterium]